MDLPEALSTAIDYEHRVRDHYAAAAGQALDTTAKKVFATLAREEQGHVTYLEARLEEWRSSGAVTDAELPSVLPAPTVLRHEAERLAAASRGKTLPSATEVELMKVALELERTTSGYYRRLVGELPAQHRHLFERFLEIEVGHLAIVQAELDAMAGLGHWFDVMEFSLEAE
jgi:rubrerythrin